MKMIENLKGCASVLLFLVCTLPATAQTLPDSFLEPGVNKNRPYLLGDFGEIVDTYTGHIKIVNTDMVVPGTGGLDINITRWSESPANAAPGGAGVPWNLHFGQLKFSAEFVDPFAINPPPIGSARLIPAAPILELPGGDAEVLLPAGDFNQAASASVLMSRNRWKAVPDGTDQAKLLSPGGRVYTMKKNTALSQALTIVYLTTQIQDRNGNTLTILYNAEGSLERITASDGRVVTFSKTGSTLTVSYLDRRVVYSYDANWNFTVTLPDGVSKFIYTYDGNNPGELSSITNPYGAQEHFAYQNYHYDNAGKNYKRIAKRTTPDSTWHYTFAEWGNGDGVFGKLRLQASENPTGHFLLLEVSNPDDTKIYYQYWSADYESDGNTTPDWERGLPKRISSFNATGTAPVRQVDYTWDQQKIGWCSTVGYTVKDYSTSILTKLTTTLDGAVFTTEYKDFDKYGGNAHTVVETGSAGTRTTRRTFDDKTSEKWMLHMLDAESVDGTNGQVDRQYDSNGNLSGIDRYGVKTQYTYFSNGNPHTVTTPNGNTTTYDNYKLGIPQSESHPESVNLTRVVDDYGRVTGETNGRGYTTGYGYDELNRLTSVDPPRAASAEVSIAYSLSERTTTVTRGNFRNVTSLDGLGRPVSVTNSDTSFAGSDVTVTTSYYANGLVAFRSQPNSTTNGQGFSYDVLGRLVKETSYPNTAIYTTRTFGNGPGRWMEVRDEREKYTLYTYKGYGDPETELLTRTQLPNLTTHDLTYNLFGQLKQVNVGGTPIDYEYYDNLYLKSIKDRATGTTTFGRDSDGNMTSRQVGSSGTTYFDYDGLGRLYQIRYPGDTGTAGFTYNKTHQRIGSSFAGTQRTLDYDENGNLDWERLSVDGLSFQADYQIDSLDHVYKLTYPSVGGYRAEVVYNPDALGRARQVGNLVSGVKYFPNGMISEMTYGNGLKTTNGLDERLLPSSYQVGNYRMTYGFDYGGNLTNVTDKTTGTFSMSATYDDNTRLLTADGKWGSAGFTYTALDDIASKTVGGKTFNYEYESTWQGDPMTQKLKRVVEGPLNDLSAVEVYTFQYDAYGNVISDGRNTFSYNDAGQMVRLTGGGRPDYDYGYDAGGLRVKKVSSGLSHYYFHTAAGVLLGEFQADGNWIAGHVYLQGTRVATVGGETQSQASSVSKWVPIVVDDLTITVPTAPTLSLNAGRVTYFHNDLLGSPIACSDTSGSLLQATVYRPYGEIESGTPPGQNPIAYTGKVQDAETGLVYMNARYYNPVLGRFYAVDPVEYSPGNPFSFNRYAYANDNPYKFVDPDGRESAPIRKKIEKIREKDFSEDIKFGLELDANVGEIHFGKDFTYNSQEEPEYEHTFELLGITLKVGKEDWSLHYDETSLNSSGWLETSVGQSKEVGPGEVGYTVTLGLNIKNFFEDGLKEIAAFFTDLTMRAISGAINTSDEKIQGAEQDAMQSCSIEISECEY